MDLNVIESRSFMVTNDAQQTAVWLVSTHKQVVQSNLTYGRITAASFGPPGHEQFSRIRRLATMSIMLPLAYSSPQHKWHLERFSHFAQLTAECHRACRNMFFP